MNEYYIAELVLKIMREKGDSIQQFPVMMNIIDQQYERSNRYFTWLTAIFITTTMAPFLVQLFVRNSTAIITCNCVMMVSAVYFFLIELKQIADSKWEYFTDFWNINDLSCFFMMSAYFIIRMKNIGED
jgi:hypothetical protein